MKISLIIAALLAVSVVAQINYADLSTFTTSSNSQCQESNPWSSDFYSFQSPIAIGNSGCLPYDVFELSMTSVSALTLTLDATTGAPTATYTGATLKKDASTWTSTNILFRRKAEHRLYTANVGGSVAADAAQAPLEMQIIFENDGQEITYAAVSFLIMEYNTSSRAETIVRNQLNPGLSFPSTTSPYTVTVDLKAISDSINNKLDQGLYLNMFNYNGTLTYPPCNQASWFVYGNYLYADASAITAIDSILSNFGSNIVFNTTTSGISQNARAFMKTTTVSSGVGGGVQYAARLCFTGYFDIYMNWNYGLWFGTVIVTCFFIITLSIGDRPITDSDYVEECKTIHPWVSLKLVGNELFTRKLRASLIMATMTIHALFSSAFYRVSNNPTQPANIIVYAVYSMIISQVYIWLYGNILRIYYVAKRQYLQTKEEKWNQRAQNRLFAFYSALFAMVVVLWPFTVWNMAELNPHKDKTSSNYWVASFFLGLGLEWLVIDPLWCLLASKSNSIKEFIGRKGYFYDNLCHLTYMDYIKQD